MYALRVRRRAPSTGRDWSGVLSPSRRAPIAPVTRVVCGGGRRNNCRRAGKPLGVHAGAGHSWARGLAAAVAAAPGARHGGPGACGRRRPYGGARARGAGEPPWAVDALRVAGSASALAAGVPAGAGPSFSRVVRCAVRSPGAAEPRGVNGAMRARSGLPPLVALLGGQGGKSTEHAQDGDGGADDGGEDHAGLRKHGAGEPPREAGLQLGEVAGRGRWPAVRLRCRGRLPRPAAVMASASFGSAPASVKLRAIAWVSIARAGAEPPTAPSAPSHPSPLASLVVRHVIIFR